MTAVVLVHGIAQQVRGPESLLDDWYPALADGLTLHGATPPDRADVSMAFYGDVFRPPGHRGVGLPELTAEDVTDPVERELLLTWWEHAAEQEPAVPGPHDPGARLRTPHLVQRALDALSHSAFFAGLSERLVIASLRQVRRYLTEPVTRAAVQQRLADRVAADTRVVVAHSLGTVVAYETLVAVHLARPDWRDITLVTLGSPLAVRNVVFDRLTPAPTDGRARWPAPVSRWTNIADQGDVVALVKTLAPRFGDRVTDALVHNGARAHDVRPYLTARETGQAIAEGLSQGR